MYPDGAPSQPRFSDTPLIPQAEPSANMHANGYSQPRSTNRQYAEPAGPPYRSTTRSSTRSGDHTGSDNESILSAEKLQELLKSKAVLPAVAVALLLLNHHDTLFGWLRGVGFIDTIALLCLGASAYLTGPLIVAKLTPTFAPTASPTAAGLPGLADNIAKLSSAVQRLQRDPEPKRWLDMYYNMASDIDSLLQETVQLRKAMQSLQDRPPPGSSRDKSGWKRINSSFSKSEKGR